MDASTSSSLTRYRAAIAACASLAAVGSIWYLWSSAEDRKSGLHRSNAVRGRPDTRAHASSPGDAGDEDLTELINTARQLVEESSSPRPLNNLISAVDETPPQWFLDGQSPPPGFQFEPTNRLSAADETPPQPDSFQPPPRPVAADDDQTEHDIDASEGRVEGHHLKRLAFFVAKQNHDRDGLVHHGVTCDDCQELPIKGTRYHCNNCPDFDLCESCEAKDRHIRTHVFTKIRIPASWAGKVPAPVWYPGTPHKMPSSLTQGLKTLRNELAETSGFDHSKIDGLWLQFSCMAVPDPNDPDEMTFAITREIFNQCFIAQLMTDKRFNPNLVKDRLFKFYDTNGDGVIDFQEFVLATAMIHSRAPDARRKRVFKGLDLNDDGYVSRKDCQLMFRSFYTLNREVLLGYMAVDRTAENALLLQIGQDPKDHIASGRSLANYFSGGYPNRDRRPAWDGPRPDKRVDEFGDDIPRSDEITTTRTDHARTDYYSADAVAKTDHLQPGWLIRDEMYRLCTSGHMRYLTSEHARAFESEADVTTTGQVAPFWVHNGRLWVADDSWSNKRAYLHVEREDVSELDELLKHATIADELPETFKSRYHAVHATVRERLVKFELWDAVLMKGDEKHLAREKRSKLGLEDEIKVLDLQAQEEPEDGLSGGAGPANDFVGDTAAAHTIFTVARDGLDEMLDDLFRINEMLAHEVAHTSEERMVHKKQIAEHLSNLYQRQPATEPIEWKTYYGPQGIRSDRQRGRELYGTLVTKRKNRKTQRFSMVKSLLCKEPYFDAKILEDNERMLRQLYWALEFEARDVMQYQSNQRAKNRSASFVSAFERQAKPDVCDPTMPQFRPNSVRPTDSSAVEPPMEARLTAAMPLTQERLEYLVLMEAVDRNHQEHGGAGHLDMEHFDTALNLIDDQGNKILAWMGSWLDMVYF